MNDFEQQIAPTPRVLSPKLMAIIGGTVVLVVVIILAVVWLVNSHNSAGRSESLTALAQQDLERSIVACDKENNSEACQANLVEDTALKSGLAELCGKLEGEAEVSCVWKFAREQYKPEVCDLIDVKEKQTECFDSVYRALATRDVDISWCEKISSDVVRTRCINTMSEEIATTKGCSGTGIDQSVCDRFEALNKAKASEDPDQCLALAENNDQINCLNVVGSGDRDHDDLEADLETSLGSSDTSIDSDGDGLTDADEYHLYKTDPSKADTDGDGYSDGDEIKSGYNPLGSGKL